MKLLILDPFQYTNKAYLIRSLLSHGHQVMAIGQEAWEDLSNELRGDLLEYYRVQDMAQLDQIKRAMAFLMYKHGKADQVYALSWDYEETLHLLRKEFHLPDLKLDQELGSEDLGGEHLPAGTFSALLLFDPSGRVMSHWILQDSPEGILLDSKLGLSETSLAFLAKFRLGPLLQVQLKVDGKGRTGIQKLSNDLEQCLVLELVNYVQARDSYREIAEAFGPCNDSLQAGPVLNRKGYLRTGASGEGVTILHQWQENNGSIYEICLGGQ